jgi:chlorobactene glucosyltransferase
MRFLVSLINYISNPILPKTKPISHPLVSILIPVRNEVANICNLLETIINQDYTNLEIIVCNDQSTDNTVKIVENFIKNDPRIRLIHIETLPNDWLGKNNACHNLANEATGAHLCFLDADVTLKPYFISSVIAYMFEKKVSLLSLFPQQIMISTGEKATVPIMLRILLSLLPLKLVKVKYFPSLSAANGQCMIFKRQAYFKHLPHKLLKNIKAEDIATARYFKSQKEPISCLLGNNQIYCHMYNNYQEAINGFSKNLNAFFGGSFIMAFLYGLFSSILFLPIWYFKNLELFILVFCLMFSTTLLNTINASLEFKGFFKLKILQELSFWHILYLSIKYKLKKTGTWKGRNI